MTAGSGGQYSITRPRDSRHFQGSALVAAAVAVALASLVSLRVLSSTGWDATIFVGFGEEATAIREYGEERLGDVFLRADQGHDGKYFFVQANDPLVLEPELSAELLERPLYRAQRMFYPLIAGAGGAFSPEVVVWSLLVTNIIAIGAGTFATASIAKIMGLSPWWGMAFGLNIGFISEMSIDGAGIVAAAAAFGAIALLLKERYGWGILLLALAALSREAMLIAAVGSGWWLWKYGKQPRTAATVAAIPTAAVALWAIYLRWRIGGGLGVSEVQEIGWPFVGFFQAFGTWIGVPLEVAIGIVLLSVLLVYPARALMARELVGWAFLGFAFLGTLFTQQVWEHYFDITRAIAPLITAFVLLIAASRFTPRRTRVRP